MCDPIIGAAAIGVGGSILQGRSQASAARNASQAAERTSNQQVALYRDIYNQQRQDLEPFRQSELARTNLYNSFFNIDPVGQQPAANTNSVNAFMGGGGVGIRPGRGGGAVPNAFMARLSSLDGGNNITIPNALADSLPVQDTGVPAASNGANDNGEAGEAGGVPGLIDPSIPGAEAFNNSVFNPLAQTAFNQDRDRIDANLAGSGLVYSDVRQNAVQDAGNRALSSNVNAFLSALTGAPATPATNAGINAANAYGGQVGNALGQRGYAQQQSAYQQGQANANMWGGVADAAGFGLGAFSIGGKK